VRKFVRDVAQTIVRARLTVHASNIAFKAAFSIGPLLALTLAILSSLPGDRFVRSLRDLVLPYAPDAARPLLAAQIRSSTFTAHPLVVTLSIVGVLWSISAWTFAISIGLEAIGWKVHAGIVVRRIRSAAAGLVMAVALALSAIAAVLGPAVLRFVSRATSVPLVRLVHVAWLRWPVAALLFGLACGSFVRLGTAERPGVRAIFWGGLTAGATSWVATSMLGVYLARAPGLHAAYAAAGTMFALLLWLYLLAIGLLAGASVAFVLDHGSRDSQRAA